MTLNDYLQQTQRFLRDQRQEALNPGDLVSYVNRARREVAMKTQCVRVLTPITGSIIGWSITNGGTGYSNSPTLTITAPDFPSGALPYPNGLQATADAIVIGGVIQSITANNPGAGYWEPQLTITDSTGIDATATPILSFINQLNQGQEVYNFSDIDTSMFPGVGAVYMIKSVSIIYSNYRYSLPCYSFSTYQAMIRQYPFQYQYVPTFAAQFGQGTNGSFFLYPLPSQQYQMEFDCFCLPQNLTQNGDSECIPDPWTDAIPYFAASLAYEELQNWNAAKYYFDKFMVMTQGYSNYARPGRVTNPYGRY